MSKSLSVDSILEQAKKQEKEYDWSGATESYDEALRMAPELDCIRRGEIYERIGHSLFRAASQADNVEEFKKRMQLSSKAYEQAAESLGKIDPARSAYCKAMARYSDSWSTDDPSQKKELLDDCWRLMKEALAGFEGIEHWLGYAKAFQGLSFCLIDRDILEGDWHERKRIAEDAVKYGQNAISTLSKGSDANGIAWAYVMTSYFMVYWLDFFEERRTEFVSMISSHLEKALRLAKQIEDAYFLFFMYATLCGNSAWIKGDWQGASSYAEEYFRQSQKLRDHYRVGQGYWVKSFMINFEATTEEDPDKLKEKHKLAIQYAEESIPHYLLVCRYDSVVNAYQALIENHIKLAELETGLERKHALLEQTVKVGLKGSEYAKLSGSAQCMTSVFHSLSKAMLFLSEIEKNANEKRKLLEEALHLREETIKISGQLLRPSDWDNGVYQNYLGLIYADLANIEESEDKKRHLLEEAVQRMEKCIEICTTYLQKDIAPSPRNFAVLGWFHDWFGRILDQLYSLTRDEKVTDKTIEVYESAAKVYRKAGMPSRVAEAYWKAAKLFDRRGEHTRAADNFELASKNYQLVAEKIPQFKDLYRDYAVYMQAWSEIEKARNHHERQEYDSAKEHFEKAADAHKSLRQWSYLAANYSAWAQVENAEELSRKEQSEEAITMFEQAVELFSESKELLQAHLSKIENPEENLMATNMVKATDMREKYCMARIAVEEARILDKKGDHYSSSEKYGSAAENFEKIGQALESEQERKEFKLIISLSRAWQKMTLAEAEASPILYAEASKLFEETKELSSNEKTKMLLLGHSRFCKALEAGTRFADSRNTDMYSEAIRCLESAANYYVKAGFPRASEYSEATKLLLDAYLHMDSAAKESDPEKKTRIYAMAEKVLQTSAGSFMRAEHPEKREQVLRLLEKTRKERELAMSLTEVLHAPSVVSGTSPFTTPTPTQEEAVGSERFEHADIQANLIVRQKELKVGENLDLEIEFVNAGKRPAQLIKVTGVISKDFELAEKPDIYRVEDNYLNMKGKRLDPLKTEEVRLVLKPKLQGVFPLKATILYLDENGKYRSHEVEPVTVTVKELGIKGWLKGER
jgi:hypothetical protein